MELSDLKLASLNHCFVHLPEFFILKYNLTVGSLVSIRSIQNDTEIKVVWNGQLSCFNTTQLDLTFATANKFQDGGIVLSDAKTWQLNLQECSLCRVELVEATDYSILSQHLDANVLDTCKFVFKDMIMPIWLSQNVKVLVKIITIEPNREYGILTKTTEFQYQHSMKPSDAHLLSEVSSQVDAQTDLPPIIDPIPFVSCSLGLDYRTQFNLGPMLVCGESGSGKTHYLKTVMKNYARFKSELFDCTQLRGKRVETVKKILGELLTKAQENQPFILGLDDVDSFVASDAKHDDEKGQEVIYRKRLVDALCWMFEQLELETKCINILIIATAQSLKRLDSRLSEAKGKSYFNEIVKLKDPTVSERTDILKSIIDEYCKNIESDLDQEQLDAIAKKCSSFMPTDLRRIVERSIISACSRSMMEFNSDPLKLKQIDFVNSLKGYTPTNLRGVSLQAKTFRTFAQVGGMQKVKDILRKTVLLQIKYPKLFKKCPTKLQSSILLYGPPGCGKTLVAEALCNEENINSICVRGPELLSKYIGASEAAVRDLFRRAQLARPCLVFFDEFESLVSKRGADSTGVTDRVVNQFLTLLDGVEELTEGVFIVAASSRPDMIDPAILRPGRLDKHVFCGLPDQADRLEILRVMSRDIEFVGGHEARERLLMAMSHRLDGFTGADCQSLLYSAQMKALHELLGAGAAQAEGKEEEEEEKLGEFELVRLGKSHLEAALDEMKAEVGKRYADLISKYPPTIRTTPANLAAMRATLA